jgi:hypothetical protein
MIEIAFMLIGVWLALMAIVWGAFFAWVALMLAFALFLSAAEAFFDVVCWTVRLLLWRAPRWVWRAATGRKVKLS